ncbi:hypothetical protein [Bacillus badius]|uniref:Uncharacterized protein n=1 Tax=Bacillus badius TaxID=1455 RepID=A0ABR5B1B3_BACBA|nr:hypothetical protein [Bacillus badius]KIL80757.1 hypothetical protein SD77_0605 [Bacillus badius]MED4715315.1 hypothetical protein [Bacillus badius]
MNWKSLVLSIIVTAGLGIMPTILGESLKNPIYILYLVAIIALLAIIQFLISELQKYKDKIEVLEETSAGLDKELSNTILLMKAEGKNYFDVAIQPIASFPPRQDSKYSVRILVNSKEKIAKVPELTFITESNIELYKNQVKIQKIHHNDNNIFLLNSSYARSFSEMFFSFEFEIIFKESGVNNFKLVVELKERKSEIKSFFTVQ